MGKHSPPADTGTRLHALDNLRALLMWLGIVLHVEAIYAVQRMPNAWRDDQRTLVADVVVSSIHAFRMPAFFILGGFFAALLVRSRGPDGLLRHRLMRLGLPFALFWPLLWLASGVAALFFMNLMVRDEWGLDTQVVPNLPILDSPNTIHLWFLWMLLWLCVATAVLWRLPRAWFAPIESALAWLARQPWGFVALALPLMLASAAYPRGVLAPAGAFLPEWNEWLYHGSFFVFAGLERLPDQRTAYLLELLMPHMHLALHRMRQREADESSTDMAPVTILSKREIQVLHWVRHGKTNFEISQILGISPPTVKNHVQKIMRKLNVNNRAQAVGKSATLRLVTHTDLQEVAR